jgi:hypothetical protein
MQGRLPLDLSLLRDSAEDNIALAMTEQEASELALGFLAALRQRTVDACADGRVTEKERAELMRGFDRCEAMSRQQLAYDRRDEEMGREINERIGVLIATREPQTKRAAR